MTNRNSILKPSVFYHSDNSAHNPGVNLDKWLFKALIDLGVISNTTDCCKYNNLYIKTGFAYKSELPDTKSFNFNKYLRNLLLRLNIPINTYCCLSEEVKTQHASVYYSKEQKMIAGLSLDQWIKNKLEYYLISFTDPCCQ